MKTLLTFFLFLFLFAQLTISQVAVNTDGTAPNGSAMLDVNSADKGVLLPRMTHSQLMAIVSPASGLLVFCTDCGDTGSGAMAIFINGTWNLLNASCLNPAAPVAGTHTVSYTQIVWNWNAVPGATGYRWSMSNDYAGAYDWGTNTSMTELSLSCGTSYTRYAWAYNDCGHSSPVVMTQSTTACPSCPSSITINHAAGAVAPVTKTVTYGIVSMIPGEPSKCWITGNLGAHQQPTFRSDATEASAGWYWQFNRKQGYQNDGSSVTPAWTITSIIEDSGWTPANDPCALELGAGWRIPTNTEWENVDAADWWYNWNDPWSSGLKMHAAGYLNYTNGSLVLRGSYGAYWSSSQPGPEVGTALYFDESFCYTRSYGKAYGFPLRCLKD
jgi:hypothetical protein